MKTSDFTQTEQREFAALALLGDAVEIGADRVRQNPGGGAREARRLQVRQWKSEFKMFAYKGCAPDWLALSMTESIEALDGYDLTEEERTNGVDLLAGYCRLLDEANLVDYGATEYEACRKIAERLVAAGRCAPDRERKSPTPH